MATSVIYELPYTYTMSQIHSLIFQNPPGAQRFVRPPDLVVLGLHSSQRSLCEGFQPSDQNPPSAQRFVRLEPALRVPSCFADSPDLVEGYKEKERRKSSDQGHTTFTLPESVLHIIQILDDSIVVPVESTNEVATDCNRVSKPSMSGNRHVTHHPTNNRRAPPYAKRGNRTTDDTHHQGRNPPHRSDKRGSKDLESDSSNWNAHKPVFKATKMEIKEGIDKDINDIRILLNKLSNKKYDDQKTEILTLIQTIFEKLEEGEGEGDNNAHEAVQKIGQFIFDIASTNQFFSELYAGLYEDLVAQHAVFTEILEVFVEKFQSTLDAVPYCDPNTDYDGFCQYTKHNERRRATASFFVMLVVRKVLSGERLATLVVHIQRIMETAITEENRTNEVEELTEVLFLLITLGATLLRADDSHCWESSIFPTLQTMSQRKAKEFTSLSSRAVFKHRDILDKLTKLTK